jgi:hypothetical protein
LRLLSPFLEPLHGQLDSDAEIHQPGLVALLAELLEETLLAGQLLLEASGLGTA